MIKAIFLLKNNYWMCQFWSRAQSKRQFSPLEESTHSWPLNSWRVRGANPLPSWKFTYSLELALCIHILGFSHPWIMWYFSTEKNQWVDIVQTRVVQGQLYLSTPSPQKSFFSSSFLKVRSEPVWKPLNIVLYCFMFIHKN